MAATTRDALREALAEVAFPASKNDLVDAAIRKGDPTAVQALRDIAPTQYADLDEVFRVVTLGDGGV
ncbi:DUF2795 domain-containing protein [Saccharothrix sp.]|uniref:DUF2795 domain-containing protein n=1 Tax=Saccharothrix sp. TaxID=1873460 RepID=UPI0028125EDD|nr:DUF2795 domain-containing protein [Saccharothrix sp.]